MKKDKEEMKSNKRLKSSLIFSILIAILGVLIIHLRIGRTNSMGIGLQELIGSTGGYLAILGAIFLFLFVVLFLLSRGRINFNKDLTSEELKNKKHVRSEVFFFLIDAVMTVMFTTINWNQISSIGTLWAIAEVAAFFGIVWGIFELYHKFGYVPGKLIKLMSDFFVKVCIPMLFLILILLGAYQAKYKYTDTFSPAINESAIHVGEAIQRAYTTLVFSLYNIGQSNPDVWSWLPILAFFALTLVLISQSFMTKTKSSEDKTAQEIIDEALADEALEKAYASGEKKKPLTYDFFKRWTSTKKQRKQEKKDEEDFKNTKFKIYDIKLIGRRQ